MPNVRKEPRRSVVVPDDLWSAAKAAAKARDESVSEVIRRALRRYVGEGKK